MRVMSEALKREIRQNKPFRSIYEEVLLTVLRTADRLSAPLSEVLREAGLSSSQYNVLRILRGAGEDGLPSGEISQRMVQRDPDLTRLLDRLEARGLVSRARGTEDRRVVRAFITADGEKLLEELRGPVDESLRASMRHVPQKDLRALLELLDRVRQPSA
jgi:MarR family transcriptional regulator, organic hydroperoxide resistance regulator